MWFLDYKSILKVSLKKFILAYQQDNNISDEEIANKINLSVPEVEDILFGCIEKFTLDRLMTYANFLFSPNQVKIVIEKFTKKQPSIHAG